MSGKKGVIETGVDKLVKLVNERKRISIKDASKELGVSESNVEEWSEFLEDAGLITIETKLATLYLLERQISNKELLEKLKDVSSEKDNFVRKVESSVNGLMRDSDEIKLIDSEFHKIKSFLENNFSSLGKKLDRLDDFKRVRSKMKSQEESTEKDFTKSLDGIDARLKVEQKEFEDILKDISQEMARIKTEGERLVALKEEEKELQKHAGEMSRLLEKVRKEMEDEDEVIAADQEKLKMSVKAADALKERIKSDSSELESLTAKLKVSRKEFEDLDKEFKKDLDLVSSGKIDELSAYKEGRSTVESFRSFLSRSNEIESLIKTAEKEDELLKKDFTKLAKSLQAISVMSSAPKVRESIAALSKELEKIEGEKSTMSDKLRKLRMIMRSLVK